MAAGTWERSESDGYRVKLTKVEDTPSSRVSQAISPRPCDMVTSERRPVNVGGLGDRRRPAISESSGFSLRPEMSALPSQPHVGARSTPVRGRKPVVMPGSYDGSSSLVEYLSHFTLVTQVNGWSSQEAALYLGVSLAGPARRLLSGIDLDATDGLDQLVAALERRFQPRDQEAIFRAQLKSKRQQKGESISKLSDSIEQLVRQAYPSADAWTLDELNRDYFTAALASNEHRQWVHQARPTSYPAAVAVAQHAEAYFRAEEERGVHRLRTVIDQGRAVGSSSSVVTPKADPGNDAGSPGDRMLKKILDKLEQLTSQTSRYQSPSRSQDRRCYGCGAADHLKRDCPRQTRSRTEVPSREHRGAFYNHQMGRQAGNDGRLAR